MWVGRTASPLVLAGGLLSRPDKPSRVCPHGTAHGVGEAIPGVHPTSPRQGKKARPSCATILGFLLSAFIWPTFHLASLLAAQQPWSDLKNSFLNIKINFVSKILEVVFRPEFAQDHESGLRSYRGPVVLLVFDFSKLRFWKSPYEFLNLYGRFCPYNPPYKPGKKSAPLFSRRGEHFQKLASVVQILQRFPIVPRRPIFEKCCHLRGKGGVLMLLKTTPHL